MQVPDAWINFKIESIWNEGSLVNEILDGTAQNIYDIIYTVVI